jgi:hypothetical protein
VKPEKGESRTSTFKQDAVYPGHVFTDPGIGFEEEKRVEIDRGRGVWWKTWSGKEVRAS